MPILLESMGFYCCEKPERSRSTPLLTQEKLFKELPELEGEGGTD